MWRRARRPYSALSTPPGGTCPECAILAGDSVQFHTGANTEYGERVFHESGEQVLPIEYDGLRPTWLSTPITIDTPITLAARKLWLVIEPQSTYPVA